jgi:predicted site-specific integrase-resolvase
MANAPLISTEQAASVVGVTTPTIARWVRRGLITPVIKGRRAVGNDAHSHWFDVQDVLALQRPQRAKPTRTVSADDLVTKRQIQELLSIGPVKVWKWVKEGKLEVVTRGGTG